MLSESKQNELIQAVKDALLRTSCNRDADGNIVYNIYADHSAAFR